MAYWLLKSDPDDYSFSDLLREKKTAWTGVKNNLALKHLRAMKKGDRALMYHTGAEKAIVGTATIASDPTADPKGGDSRLVTVDVEAEQLLPVPVRLEEIKADGRFAAFALVRNSRLSVMPVDNRQWEAIMGKGRKQS